MRALWTAMVAVGLIVWVPGCPRRPAPSMTPSPPPAKVSSPGKAVVTQSPAPAGFEWTENPSVAMVPDLPLKGVLNGNPFEAKSVLITTNIERKLCHVSIRDEALASDTALLMGGTGVDIDLPSAAHVGQIVVKSMDQDGDGGACYYYQEHGGGAPLRVDAPWAVALSIGEGDAGTYDPNGEVVQVTGHFRGKLAICFDDRDPESDHPLPEPSWLAGTFDAKVQYREAPTPAAAPSE